MKWLEWFNWYRGFWFVVCSAWLGNILLGFPFYVSSGDFIINTCIVCCVIVVLWTTRHSKELIDERMRRVYPVLAIGGPVLFLMGPALGLEFSEFMRWNIIVAIVAYPFLIAMEFWLLKRELARKMELCKIYESQIEYYESRIEYLEGELSELES